MEETLELPRGALESALSNVTVLESLSIHRQFVLLGDPGSGKSTLTRRMAGMLAARGLDPRPTDMTAAEETWAADLERHLGGWFLPVRVVMSQWARNLATDATGCADTLIQECMRVITATAELPGARQKEHFVQRLTATPATAVILLDGLDEVTDAAKRRVLLDAVDDFAQAYAHVPLLVTCRVRPYTQGEGYRAAALPTVTLAPLTQGEIRRFLQRWHDELARVGIYQPPAAAESARLRLQNALDDPKRDQLADMAGIPLLLTMMARVNFKSGLPNSRAKLYEEYVKQLLWEWERAKLDDRGGHTTGLDLLLQENDVSHQSLERALNQLAYEVHAQVDGAAAGADDGAGDTVDIDYDRVRGKLEAIHSGGRPEKAAWAAAALDLIDDRSGLLYAVTQGATYRFTHRTFQEYLAARHLAGGGVKPMVQKLRAVVDDPQWREAVFLALGYHISVLGEYDIPIAVINELLPDAPQDETAWRRAVLLGEAYVRLLGPQRAAEAELTQNAQQLIARVPPLLTAAMQQRTLPPDQRLDAGILAAELGLEPPGLDDFLPLDDWMQTPAGDRFRMARYPVTNAQYRRFMDAEGYATERFWSTEGRKYRNREKWTEPRYWDNSRFKHATQPVVGVSWYEATAYCMWLTEHLRAQGVIGAREEARLPTQAEWEAAARSNHGKEYPWGSDAFDPARANTEESKLERTTPVHMYPDGATSDGVWDLAGNVWEWTQDIDTDGLPWMRGGSWWNHASRVGASARGRVPPALRGRGGVFGFRVVVVPISH
ncbi:MAG: SUMF1/EgtB/PvdO family nonheme iron enzyme [Caldilineaceae bacterium]|nr:SUMF1/EgtB/PvdO family nonheme iron enzyme [Caldilineaceae bacterium]